MQEYTTEEIREQFIQEVRSLVEYWNNLPDKNQRERLSGLAFSIMTLLDGASYMPSFIVAPDPAPEDKEYHIEEKENYYPENFKISPKIKGDISGYLHDLLYDGWK
jgi:hypothetical protein